jgi:peptidoglycan/xylan/chitin deacetylase (PgdA/CDA1 family)
MTTAAARQSLAPGRLGRRIIVLALFATLVTTGCAVGTSSASIVPRTSTAPALSGPPSAAASWVPTGAGPSSAVVAPSVPPPPSPTPTPATGNVGSTQPITVAEQVPILYYHRVQAPPVGFARWPVDQRRQFVAYDVIPVAFAAQLDWLKANGYTTILPRELSDHWAHGTLLPARPVIITFDDGSSDWTANVLPMLRARGMVAEFYLTLDAISHGAITWSAVRRLAAAGNGIGAHDVHHYQLTGLGPGHTAATAQEMWREVDGARTAIWQNVGVFADSMAYVGGGYDATLERLVKLAGYSSARTIRRGIVQDPAHPYELRVVRIGVHDDVTDLVQGTLVPDLPTFAARVHGVSDKTPTTGVN